MTAKWTDFVSGAVLTAAQLNDVLDNFQDVAIFNETQAQNTNGGTFTSGAWTKRTLNTTVVNNITGCSIASSVITLPAGTYSINVTAPATLINRHQIRLQNTTDATTTLTGTSEFNQGYQTRSVIIGVFTITGTKTFEIQHRCESTRATDGLGVAANFTSEVYTVVQITRIA